MARLNKREPIVAKRRGKWVCDYYDESGKRKRPSFPTKIKAEQHKKSVMLSRLTGEELRTTQKQVTLKEAIRKYYELESTRKKAFFHEKVWFTKLYEYLANKGLVLVSDVRKIDLLEYQQELAKEVAASTVNRRFHTYKHFFNSCVDWFDLEKNPVLRLRNLPERKNPKALWTNEQISAVLGMVPEPARNVLLFEAKTGCRPIEARHLKWGDVDLERRLVRLWSDKREGDRHFPLGGELLELLTSLYDECRRSFRAKPSDLVFQVKNGRGYYRTSVGHAVKRARERLGYEAKLTENGLRHTLITRLAESNTAGPILQMLAGHSSSKTTENYLHVKVENIREAIDRNEIKYLGGE